MKPFAFALAALLASPAAAQERRTVQSREFTIHILVPEKVTSKALWVSRDGGKTWKPAKDAGVSEAWGEWANSRIPCTVRVPEDGAWDFYAQFGDELSNRTPDPAPGQPPDPLLRFDVRGQQGLYFISPKPGDEFIGGNQVIFRWTGEKRGLREKTVQIYVQVDGQPWKAIAATLDLEGEYPWVLPTTPSPTKVRFRLTAFAPGDQEVASRDLEGTLLAGRTVASLVWESPRGAAEWTGGTGVTLKWQALGLEFRERSGELSYSVEGEPWIPVTKGLEATGSYSWVVPNRETSQLRLRIRAFTRGGQEGVAVSDPVTVRSTGRPNVAEARALYDRARVLAAQQRYAEARLKYEEALAAWGEFGEALNDLGRLYAEQKEPARALEYFLRARRTCPSDPTAYVNAALVEVRLGLNDDAMEELKDAVALGVDGEERTAVLAGETLWRIASVASEAQDWKRARAAADLILKIRQASRPTRARAQELLEWIRNKAR